MFSYAGFGTINLKGCAQIVNVTKYYHYNFEVGSKVYILEKAKKGKLEPVVIKKVRRVNDQFVYTDTYNGTWMQDELVWEMFAVNLAIQYWENVVGQLDSFLEKYGC